MATAVLTFEGGLATETERTASPPNTVRELVNWVPEPLGGLRARTGWSGATAETGAPATKEPLGAIVTPSGGVDAQLWIANASSTTSVALYRKDILAGTFGAATLSGYTLQDTVSALAAGVQNFPVHFARTISGMVYIHPSFSGLRSPTGAVAGSPRGTCVCFHEGRLFIGGDPTGAAQRVFFSGLADAGYSWTGGEYFDTDGGGTVVCMRPTQYGMLIGTFNSLELLRGSGPATFQRNVLDGGNCAKGHTIVPTPYGVVIVGTTDIFLWQGGSVERVDRLVDVAQQGAWLSATYKKGKVYLTDSARSAREMWVLDMESFNWSKESVAADGNATPQVLTTMPTHIGDHLLGFAGGGLFGGGTSSRFATLRLVDGMRAIDSQTTTTETFTARTQSFFLGSSAAPVLARHLYLRIKQRGPAGSQGFNVTPYADNVAQPSQPLDRVKGGAASSEGTALGEGVHRVRVDLGFDAYEVSFAFSHAATGAPVYDIEEAILDFEAERPR